MDEARTGTGVSLREFVASDYLSNANLHFDGEVNDGNTAPPPLSPPGSSQSSANLLHSLNATKLALLLAKKFLKLGIKSGTHDKNVIDLSSLQLDNFFVNMRLGGAAKSDGRNGKNIRPRQTESATDKAQRSHEDNDLPQLIPPYQSSDAVATNVLDIGIIENVYPPNVLETTLVVLGLHVLPAPNRICDQSLEELTPMNVLANHIRVIFSPVDQKIPAYFDPTMRLDDTSVQRYPKHRMVKGDSLFSLLLETGNYPTSICRLLSDIIGVGNEGKAENPYTSIDDVILDLEQMLNYPHLFLHDPGNDFYSSNPNFDQGSMYGRVKELTRVLQVSTQLEQCVNDFKGSRSDSPKYIDGSNVVFISGLAGSGKSHFVQNVSQFLKDLGWIVQTKKFRRDMEHGSREIVSSLFDELVANIAKMEEDDYNHRSVNAISNALDPASLACLANFIPSMLELIPDVDKNAFLPTEAQYSQGQLVFLLSKLVGAILSLDRHIMICFDDLQWCDPTMIMLIKEIILSVGQNQGRHNFLFVGMYRCDEITESHPFVNQLSALQKSNNVHVTEIELSSLSRDDIVDMVMPVLRLPRRLVFGLSDIVHKKTSGHALFVVQLLNSLVRDSTIMYSPRKHRFDWDENKLVTLRTWDSVASFIASNLSLLRADALQSLRILSCFGVQIPQSLLKLIAECSCVPNEGIDYFLPDLVEGGVVEINGQSIFFCHDLLQSSVYEGMLEEDRQRLHLDIGNHIASKIALDSSLLTKSIESGVEELKLGECNDTQASISPPCYPLIAIATNQTNFAGAKSISERSQKIRYSQWNLFSGNHAAGQSNFQAALYYYKSGIALLGEGPWLEDVYGLCHELHKGAAYMLFAIGDFLHAVEQAKSVIEHVLSFGDSLESQCILIRSLDSLGRYDDAVAKGVELLHKLKFDIPSSTPSPAAVMKAMAETGNNASAYSFDQITNMNHIVDAKKRNVIKLVEAMILSGFRSSSHYLPLIGCAAVNYSLQNGICEESAIGFLILGYFKASLEGKYEEGRYWMCVVYKIIENAGDKCTNLESLNKIGPSAISRVDIMATMFLNFFYCPLKQSAFRLLKLYQKVMAIGDIESSFYALHFSLILSFHSGEKLPLISNSTQELIKSMLKHSKEGAKMAMLNKILIDSLVGNPSDAIFTDFGGVIVDEHSLLTDAQSKNNFSFMELIHFRRFLSAFWIGDYDEAYKCSKAISALPISRLLKIQMVCHTFLKGLMAFQTFRDGGGEKWLDEGKQVFNKMERWVKHCPANFANKLLLLEAEHHASMCNIIAAKAAYEASVRSARDNCLVHEQGLACELYGRFLLSVIETDESLIWFKCAHACYLQWGAVAKAEQVWNDHNLGVSTVGSIGNFPHEMPSIMKRKDR